MNGSPDPGPRTSWFDPRRALANELVTSVLDGFTLSAVGDCVLSRPMSQFRSSQPAFGALLDVLDASSVVYGNLETVIFDPRTLDAAPYPWEDDWPLACDPSTAADVRGMGFDVLSRANNHTLDWGLAGMRECSRHLDEQGLTHAGCGETLGLARQARFCETPQGRVGIVSCVSTYRDTTEALDQQGAAPGRPGVNPLPVRRFVGVPEILFDQLASIRAELAQADMAGLLAEFEAAADRGAPGYRYEVDSAHLAAILRQVRQGKEYADFMLVALHAHESLTSPDPRPDWTPELPAGFIAEFGRQAIDAGADAVVVSGLHHLGPILMHDRRPILTGLGNFFWSDIQTPVPSDLYARNADRMAQAFEHPERATDADVTLLLNFPLHAHPDRFLSAVAEMQFSSAGLERMVLHPVDMGYGEKLSLSGLPRLATPAVAQKIFDRLDRISNPYGTSIARVPDTARNTTIGEVVP
jgi:poly-gamma-glutamate capsule biosynthesis protein CapA/YwtB (metallophosphatase superfamily)